MFPTWQVTEGDALVDALMGFVERVARARLPSDFPDESVMVVCTNVAENLATHPIEVTISPDYANATFCSRVAATVKTEDFATKLEAWRSDGTLDRLSTLLNEGTEVSVYRSNGNKTPCRITSIAAGESSVIVEWVENGTPLQKLVYTDTFIAANPELFPERSVEP